MANKTIRVHTPFDFNHEDGTSQHFEVGNHVVDSKIAEHWFVAAHAEITGSAKSDADNVELQARIDSLTTQLADKDKTIGDLQQSVTDKEASIADLTTQLAALQNPAKVENPVQEPASEGNSDGKKQKSANNK